MLNNREGEKHARCQDSMNMTTYAMEGKKEATAGVGDVGFTVKSIQWLVNLLRSFA